jgi:hypothetical protein
MPDSPIPAPVDEDVDGPPPDDELLRRRVIPEAAPAPVAAAPAIPAASSAPVASAPAGRAIPEGSTEDLENRGMQARTMGTPIPAAPMTTAPEASPEKGSMADLENRSLANFEHPKSAPIQTGVASLWSKAQNIHNPVLRVLGEIGAGGARALDAIGTGVGRVIPAVGALESAIPGSTMNKLYNDKAAAAKQEQEDVSAQREAQTEHEKAETGAVPATVAKTEAETKALENPQPKPKEEDWTLAANLAGPNGEPVEYEKNSGQFRYGDLAGVKQTKGTAETQEQNKLAYQGTVGKIAAAGLPTDPKAIDKSLDAALKNGTITPEEHAAAKAYESANTTPGTNLTVHLAGEAQANSDAINKMFEGKEVLAHMPDGSRVLMSYDDAKKQNIPPERLVALNAKEAQDTRDKVASTQTTFQGLDRYRSDLKKAAPSLSQSDKDALGVITSHNQDAKTGGLLAGLIDDIPAIGPIDKYANKMVDGVLGRETYKQLSPQAKKLVSDYFTAVIDNFANMKNIMGSVGRNPIQLQAEINTIPLPTLDWESASDQFDNKRASLAGRASSMPTIYTPPKQATK